MSRIISNRNTKVANITELAFSAICLVVRISDSMSSIVELIEANTEFLFVLLNASAALAVADTESKEDWLALVKTSLDKAS